MDKEMCIFDDRGKTRIGDKLDDNTQHLVLCMFCGSSIFKWNLILSLYTLSRYMFL